jgi:hypothetical protein
MVWTCASRRDAAATLFRHIQSIPQGLGPIHPTPAEWASLTIEPVAAHDFRAEHITEGKIAVDEDRCTPVFSPYTYPVDGEAGRSGGGSPCAPSSRRMGSERNGILCSSSLRNACELTSVPSLHATTDFIQCFIMTASSTPLSPLP